MIQQAPVCYHCSEPVEGNPVYAPPLCDHQGCASAVFHGVCLMEFREWREDRMAELREAISRHERGECSCFQPPER